MPRNVPHAWKSTGVEPGRVLFLYTPGRAGGLFEEMAENADGSPAPDAGKFYRAGERHSWEVIGPPPF